MESRASLSVDSEMPVYYCGHHGLPGGPLMPKLFSPKIDPISYSFPAHEITHGPARLGIFAHAFATQEINALLLPKAVEHWTIEVRKVVHPRIEIDVVVIVAVRVGLKIVNTRKPD